MNLRAFENFLRHLLFLFIILKGIGAIIILHTGMECHEFFNKAEFLPLKMPAPNHSVNSALFQMDMSMFLTGVATILICVIGFFGAIYLYTYPVLNFTVGVQCSFLLIGEIGGALTIAAVVRSLDVIVVDYVSEVFTNSNRLAIDNAGQHLLTATWHEPYEYGGWVAGVGGTEEQHDLIDYIQTSFRCCGLWGRTFWNVRNPASCCDELLYPGEKCTLGVAFTTSCLYYYRGFETCLSKMMILSGCFGLISLATLCCSLYLARLNVLYPTQNFGSQSSLDTEDN